MPLLKDVFYPGQTDSRRHGRTDNPPLAVFLHSEEGADANGWKRLESERETHYCWHERPYRSYCACMGPPSPQGQGGFFGLVQSLM